MATVLIVTSNLRHGEDAHQALRQSGLFPVLAANRAQALVLLAQFHAEVVVVERGLEGAPDWEPLGNDLSPETALFTFTDLPSPGVLASIVHGVLARHASESEASAAT